MFFINHFMMFVYSQLFLFYFLHLKDTKIPKSFKGIFYYLVHVKRMKQIKDNFSQCWTCIVIKKSFLKPWLLLKLFFFIFIICLIFKYICIFVYIGMHFILIMKLHILKNRHALHSNISPEEANDWWVLKKHIT